MNLFKKTTATIALVALVSGIFSTGVSANSTSEIEAANALAAAGYINNHSDDAAAYNLNQNVLRQEIAAVARGLAGLDKKATCDNTFSDVSATTPNTWACASIEALSDAGLIATNAKFNPEAQISKAEAVGMMVKAAFGSEYAYDSANAASWQEQVVDFAVSKGVVASFSNYNDAATRGFVFEAGNNADVASTEVADTCDEVSQLLGLCGDTTTDNMDTTTTTDTTTTDTTTTTTVSTVNGLEVMLSPETAAATDVPANVSGIEVMKFDVTAGNEDVSINAISMKREGLGASSAVGSVVLFADNSRISKAKTFNSTTDLAEINVTPALVIMAGETKTITAKVATIGAGKFTVSVENVNATANVELGTVVSSLFESITVASLTTATLESDGTVANPKLGEDQADLLKFKITNNGGANEDITLSSITFKDDSSNIDTDVENLTMYFNNESVAVVPTVDGKYVTFNFATPITIAEDKTEKFIIKGDIVAGASDTIDLFIDNVLDVTVKSPKNEYATVVVATNIAATAALTIQAGQVTIIDTDPVSTTVLDNKNNVVFGTFEVNATSGKDLYIDKITYNLAVDTGFLTGVVENVELYDATNGVSYDPDTTVTASANQDFTFSDLDLALADGSSVELQIRADIVNNATANAKITASITNIDWNTTSNLVIKESADDKQVWDIIPSSISFKNVEIVNADMSINALVQSPTATKVIGTNGIEAFNFEVRANNDASNLTVKELTFKGNVTDYNSDNTGAGTGTVLSNTRVNALYLYDGDTLLASKSASELNVAGEVTFDGLNIVIAENSARTLTVKIDILDDSNNAYDKIKMSLTGYYVEDSESNNVTTAATTVVSTREITISGVGTLTLTVDNTDSETSLDKNVIASSTSDFVASYQLVAINEWTKIIDMQIDETALADDSLKNAVSEVVLYANDKVTEISRQIVTSDTVLFNNVNYVAEEGSSNIYVKVVTHKIGKDEAGSQVADMALAMTVTDAEGAESGKTIASLNTQTGNSKLFSVLPTKVSALSMVQSGGGVSLTNSLSNGTTQVLGILAVTTDSSTNTNTTDGSTLKTLLENLQITVEGGLAISGLKITRINGSDTDGQVAVDDITTTWSIATVNFVLTNLTSEDNLVENASTVYFKIEGAPTLTTTDSESVLIKVSDLDTSSKGLSYKSDDSANTTNIIVDALRLGYTETNGISISE